MSWQNLHLDWRRVAAEATALPKTILAFDREGKTHEEIAAAMTQPGWMPSWGEHKDRWLTYGIAIYDTYPLGDVGMPYTVSCLKQVTGIKVAALSLFKPGMILPRHEHPELIDHITYHIGLDVPPRCYLMTPTNIFREENGKVIWFKGSETHRAVNKSDQERIILYIEARQPLMILTKPSVQAESAILPQV